MITYPLIKLTDSIGGLTQTLPAEGRSVTIGEVEQERLGRTSSGRLVIDLLSSKKKFTVKYVLIDGNILNNVIAIRQSNNDIAMQFQELYSGDIEDLIVRIVAPISRTRVLAIDYGLYEDVTIEIEEV